MNKTTYHQERSRETFDNQITQEQLHTRFLLEKIMKVLNLQCRELGIWQVQQWIKGKEDKAKGGPGLVHSKYWEN